MTPPERKALLQSRAQNRLLHWTIVTFRIGPLLAMTDRISNTSFTLRFSSGAKMLATMITHLPPLTKIVDAPLLDYAATEQYLGGVSKSTVKQLAARGAIERVRIGGRTLFVRDSLDRYIALLPRQ